MKKTPTIWAKSAALLLFLALLVGFVSYRSVPPSKLAKYQNTLAQWAGIDTVVPPILHQVPAQFVPLLPIPDSTLPEWLNTARLRELLFMQMLYKEKMYLPASKSGRIFNNNPIDTFTAYRMLEAEYYAPLLTGDEKKMYEQYVEIDPMVEQQIMMKREGRQMEKSILHNRMNAYEKIRYGTWAYQQLDASDRVRFDALWKKQEFQDKYLNLSNYSFTQRFFQIVKPEHDSILVMRLLKQSK